MTLTRDTNLPLSLVLKRIFFFGLFLLLFPQSFDFIMMEGFEEDFNKEGKHRKVLPGGEHSSVRFLTLLLTLSYGCNIRSTVFLCLAESMMDSALMNAWAGGMFFVLFQSVAPKKMERIVYYIAGSSHRSSEP